MLGRLIRKLVIALSVLLAIVLIVLSLRTRHGALLVSRASNGRYTELRSADGEFALTILLPWKTDQPLQLHRIPGDTPKKEPVLPMPQGPALSLSPAPHRWWPPRQTTGTATPLVQFQVILNSSVTPGTMPSAAVTSFSPSTNVSVAPSGTLTINAPAGGQILLKAPTPPTSLPAGAFGMITSTSTVVLTNATISASAISIGYSYEQYDLPQWAAILIVLIPAAWALVAMLVHQDIRARRRRHGHCVACGYDLHGNLSGCCPECGVAVA